MKPRISLGVVAFCLSLVASGLAGCAEEPADEALEPAGYRTVDIPYGGRALVVLVNAAPTGLSTRVVEAPGESVSGVYVESLDGIGAYTDSSGTAILSGLTGEFTRLWLEGGEEAGEVGVELNPSGLTEVAISLRSDGAYVVSQVRWSGEEVVTLTEDVSGGIPLVSIDADNQVVVVPAEAFDVDLEILGDNVRVYGEGFYQRWPTLAGSLRVYGRNAQVRGIWIDGGLEVEADQFAMTFSGISQGVTVAGDNATFLDTVACTSFIATGENLLVARSATLPVTASCPN